MELDVQTVDTTSATRRRRQARDLTAAVNPATETPPIDGAISLVPLKYCNDCRANRPLSSFRHGADSYCAEHMRERDRLKYAQNPQPVIGRILDWQKRNPDKVREYKARWRKNRQRRAQGLLQSAQGSIQA